MDPSVGFTGLASFASSAGIVYASGRRESFGLTASGFCCPAPAESARKTAAVMRTGFMGLTPLVSESARKYRTPWRILLHIPPVGAGLEVHDERDAERMDLLHGLSDQGAKSGKPRAGDFEEQFIVDLENHAGPELRAGQLTVNVNHGELDQIRRGALERRVQRDAFAERAHGPLGRLNLRHGTDAAEERAGEAGLAHLLEVAVEILLHTAVAREIGGDEFRRFAPFDAELPGQSERGKPVDNAEIDGLGRAAVLRRLRQRPDAEYFFRGARVNILAALEGFQEHGIFGKMREETQLDLRVIGGEKYAAFFGHEGGANLAAGFAAHGDVLEVGAQGAEAPGGRARLAEPGVKPAVGGTDEPGQGV